MARIQDRAIQPNMFKTIYNAIGIRLKVIKEMAKLDLEELGRDRKVHDELAG